MAPVFISYRREDSKGYAGWVCDLLRRHLGNDQVFQDIDGISPGDNFRKVIGDRLAACSVCLVLIGPRWLKARSGLRRRLFQAADFVRLELLIALNRHILVIPVLVDGAEMPSADSLPDSIVDLVSLNAVTISEHGIHEEVAALAATVQRSIKENPPLINDALQAEQERIRELIEVERDSRRRRWLKIASILSTALIAVSVMTWVARRFIIPPGPQEVRCSLTQLRKSIPTTGPHYGPDRKAPLDQSKAFLLTIPPQGTLIISLASGTSVENAFVVDSSDLSTQLRVGGNNWRGLSPMVIDNGVGAAKEVVISAWHKEPPSDAATPWSQSKLIVDAKGHLIADDGVLGNTAPDLDGELQCQIR